MKQFGVAAVALLQLVDIVIHAATDQIEPIRVVANLIILAWLAYLQVTPVAASRRLGVAAVGAYMALNAYFLAQAGWVNPASGDPRVALILLVLLTVLLSVALLTRQPVSNLK
jgi:hypothetical protein